jgi:predicted ATPase
MSDRNQLRRAYQDSLRRHGYRPDPAQEHAVARLEELRQRLVRSAARSGAGWLDRLRPRRVPAGDDDAGGL